MGRCHTKRRRSCALGTVAAVFTFVVLMEAIVVLDADITVQWFPSEWSFSEVFWEPPLYLQMKPPDAADLEEKLASKPLIKAYVINLDRSTRRWENTRNTFVAAGIPVERFPALDGTRINKDLTRDERDHIPSHHLSGSCSDCFDVKTIATSVSHFRLIRAGISVKQPRLLAEDDVEMFHNAGEEIQRAAATIELVDATWDILFFPTSHSYTTASIVRIDYNFCCDQDTGGWNHKHWNRYKAGARLYMLSQKGAEKLAAWKFQIGLHSKNDWSTVAAAVNGTLYPHEPLRSYRYNKIIYKLAKVKSDRATTGVKQMWLGVRERIFGLDNRS